MELTKKNVNIGKCRHISVFAKLHTDYLSKRQRLFPGKKYQMDPSYLLIADRMCKKQFTRVVKLDYIRLFSEEHFPSGSNYKWETFFCKFQL